jgi:hypothetical protein
MLGPKFHAHDEVCDIPVTTGGVSLPTASAFMAPGKYIVNGIHYDCTRQGLYRWFHPSGYFINRVVQGGANIDVYAVLSGISWNHVHGVQTEGDYQSMSNAGRTRKWSARCGFIAGMCAWLMPQLGVPARVVNVKTLQAANGYDDGHLILETSHNGLWRMWDMSNGCYFKDSNGTHLSTAQFMAAIANNGAFPDKVKLDYDNKYTHDCAGILDMGLYWERTLNNDADAEAWYRRVFQTYV